MLRLSMASFDVRRSNQPDGYRNGATAPTGGQRLGPHAGIFPPLRAGSGRRVREGAEAPYHERAMDRPPYDAPPRSGGTGLSACYADTATG